MCTLGHRNQVISWKRFLQHETASLPAQLNFTLLDSTTPKPNDFRQAYPAASQSTKFSHLEFCFQSSQGSRADAELRLNHGVHNGEDRTSTRKPTQNAGVNPSLRSTGCRSVPAIVLGTGLVGTDAYSNRKARGSPLRPTSRGGVFR